MPFALRRALIPVLGILGIFGCGGGGKSSESGSSTTGEVPPTPCDDATPCPEPEVCVVGQCYGGDLPMIDIVSPSDEQLVDWSNDGDTTDVVVLLQGTGLVLVPAAMDPDSERGNGQIAITVDGVEVALVDEGDLAAGVEVTIPVPTDAGGHRIRAEARISDGFPYATTGSVARRFFWFDDGRERVGFKAPFENDAVGGNEVEVFVDLAVLHFQFAPASATAEPGAVGIAHILLNKPFPTCGEDQTCLDDYITVISPTNEITDSTSGPIVLPTTTAETTDVTVHLAQTNHDPYCGEGPDACPAVWDTVTVLRAEPAGADTGGSDTGGTGSGSTTGTTGETADCGGFIASDETAG
jgi:hypothetical protein